MKTIDPRISSRSFQRSYLLLLTIVPFSDQDIAQSWLRGRVGGPGDLVESPTSCMNV